MSAPLRRWPSWALLAMDLIDNERAARDLPVVPTSLAFDETVDSVPRYLITVLESWSDRLEAVTTIDIDTLGRSYTEAERLAYDVDDIFMVYVPTAFTPDGDDLNEMLLVLGNDIADAEYHFMVFDRWEASNALFRVRTHKRDSQQHRDVIHLPPARRCGGWRISSGFRMSSGRGLNRFCRRIRVVCRGSMTVGCSPGLSML